MNVPFPTPDADHEPQGKEPETPAAPTMDPEQEAQDAGMYEAGIPGAVERRLIHVDRVTEETLVMVRVTQQQMLVLVAIVGIVGAMVWLLAREVRAAIEVDE